MSLQRDFIRLKVALTGVSAAQANALWGYCPEGERELATARMYHRAYNMGLDNRLYLGGFGPTVPNLDTMYQAQRAWAKWLWGDKAV